MIQSGDGGTLDEDLGLPLMHNVDGICYFRGDAQIIALLVHSANHSFKTKAQWKSGREKDSLLTTEPRSWPWGDGNDEPWREKRV